MRASGQSGELRYGYQVAARTGIWTIESGDRGFMFTAPIVDADDVWMSMRPLDLVLALGQVEWIWRDVAPTISGALAHVTLTRRPDVVGPRHEFADADRT